MNHTTTLFRDLKVSGVVHFLVLGLLVIVSGAGWLSVPAAHAQFGNATIAKTYLISGETAVSGDLISFDRVTQTFHLTQESSDTNLLGVVVSDPVIVLRTIAGGLPVVNSGEVYVNVTTVGGRIEAGDYVTSSRIHGKAMKAASTTSFIVGTALESFTATTTAQVGRIRVLLGIGHVQPTAPAPAPTLSNGAVGGTVPVDANATLISTPLSRLVKYLLAAIVVVGTIYLAFRNFSANLKDSVVSVGRNPLAKASIQSMIVLNTSLIVVVSAIGLFIGFMILFLPL